MQLVMGAHAATERAASDSKPKVNGTNNGHHHVAEKIDLQQKKPYQMILTGRTLVFSFVVLSLVSFGLGSFLSTVILGGEIGKKISTITGLGPRIASQQIKSPEIQPHPLSPIVLPSGKEIPKTIYTSKHFSTDPANSIDSILLARRPKLDEPSFFEVFAEGSCNAEDSEDDSSDEETGDGEEEVYKPMGQHLMIDFDNVDAGFLSSEERLVETFMELVKESGVTMLSYHCHTLEPSGVSCIGVLLESHISFHSWPASGVLSFDMFTCGSLALLPLVGYIEKLFGVPKETMDGEVLSDPPRSKWVHKERGFDHDVENPEACDFKTYLHGWGGYGYKKDVVSVKTDFQTIDIVDIIKQESRLDSYKKSLAKDGSYESNHPELFQPDRRVYLDMIAQSCRYGDAAYHESLVHPAMFAHDNPRRVAIIGGGEGATLREVLKHNTLEKVVMIEIDEIMVNVSRQYLPEWSDCSNIAGSKPSCFDDPRSEVYYEDAIAWFIDRYSEGVEFDPSDRFDVIIMDALDPSSATEFSDILYNNDNLITAIENSLTEEGILISQVGESEEGDDPPDVYTRESTVDTGYIPQLIKHGFERIQGYEDMHGGFGATWSYLIAFQDVSSSENWYGNQALIDLEIRYRLLPTISGESPLRFFDGATMLSMSYAPKFEEQTFCLSDVTPRFCNLGHGFDPDKPNVPISSLELKESSISGASLGLFTKVDIAKGSYVAMDEVVHNMMVFPSTNKIISDMAQRNEMAGRWSVFGGYLFDYGFATDYFGDASYSLDTGILAFMNHGCDGKYNIGTQTTVTEMSADPKELPPELATTYESEVYNPFVFRNSFLLHHLSNVRKDITAGDEILDNFLGYLHEVNWEKGVLNYRSKCTAGEADDGISSSS